MSRQDEERLALLPKKDAEPLSTKYKDAGFMLLRVFVITPSCLLVKTTAEMGAITLFAIALPPALHKPNVTYREKYDALWERKNQWLKKIPYSGALEFRLASSLIIALPIAIVNYESAIEQYSAGAAAFFAVNAEALNAGMNIVYLPSALLAIPALLIQTRRRILSIEEVDGKKTYTKKRLGLEYFELNFSALNVISFAVIAEESAEKIFNKSTGVLFGSLNFFAYFGTRYSGLTALVSSFSNPMATKIKALNIELFLRKNPTCVLVEREENEDQIVAITRAFNNYLSTNLVEEKNTLLAGTYTGVTWASYLTAAFVFICILPLMTQKTAKGLSTLMPSVDFGQSEECQWQCPSTFAVTPISWLTSLFYAISIKSLSSELLFNIVNGIRGLLGSSEHYPPRQKKIIVLSWMAVLCAVGSCYASTIGLEGSTEDDIEAGYFRYLYHLASKNVIDGILLSSVSLGAGLANWRGMVSIINRARSGLSIFGGSVADDLSQVSVLTPEIVNNALAYATNDFEIVENLDQPVSASSSRKIRLLEQHFPEEKGVAKLSAIN